MTMTGSKYCRFNDEKCFTNLPLLTVISEWFAHNVHMPVNTASIIYLCFILTIVWIVIKISMRMIKTLIKPIIFIIVSMIFFYTIQFSNNEVFVDYIFNFVSNTMVLVSKIVEIVAKIVGIV